MSQNAAHLRHVVTAVVVVHDGARMLPGLIQAVREQTHPVHRIIGVDTGSQDRSGATLTELLGQDAVFGMEPETGYGAAVAQALQHKAPRGSAPRSGPDAAAEWIWLLHDDCEPATDALEQLLAAAGRSRSVAVLGPKLMDMSDRRVLREAGITTDRAGRRLTGIEPGEIDQGQQDGNRAVLAVSTAGMLVRRDVWDQVGGFDPQLPLFRDDIDFCWRVHAAGYEVRVVTDAVVYHRELSARQIRKTPATGGHPRLLDRRSALYVFAVNLPFWPMFTVLGGCVAGSLVRALYFLLTKQQRKAAAQLGAVAWLLRHPVLLWRARRRRAAHRKHGYAVLRAQLPPGRALGRLAESAANLLAGGSGYEARGLHQAVVDESDDDLLIPTSDSVIRRVLTNPGVLLFIGLTVVALVAERSLAGPVLSGSGTLDGGALAPAWGGASDLWREYLAGYHDAGIGSAASAPPYLGVVAVLATLLGGKPWLAVDVLMFGCVPAAGVTAFLASRRITSVPAARIWIAATYALLPVATGAVASGRIGTGVAFVLLPLIGIAVGRVLTELPRAARRAAWAAGLLSGIAAAFVPLIWPIAVAAALAAVAAWRWLGRSTVINAAIVAAVPAAILIPWTFQLVASPSAFFGEAGLVQPGLAAARLRPESLLLLSPGGPGLPPAWVTAGLVLPAFAALLARRRTTLVYTGWGVALAGLIVAVVASRVWVTPPRGGTAVRAWPGIAIAIAAAGLLLAATPLIEAAGQSLSRASAAGRSTTNWRVLVTVAGFAVAVSAPVLAAGHWLISGVDGPVAAAGPQLLPPFVAASSAGPEQTRTLVLRRDGPALSYAVLRDTDPMLGEPELPETSASTHALEGVVASLNTAGSGDAGDTGQALGQFDIGYVLLPAPIDPLLARQLNAAAGLQPLTQGAAYDLWKVSGPVARARVVTPGGTVVPVSSGAIGVAVVVAPSTSGTLVLAEAAGGWSASLNGKPLAKLAQPVDGWAQGFLLPAGGGHLVITRNETARDVSLGIEAVALLAAFALALPGTRSASAVPAATAAAADSEAVPAAGRRRDRAEGARSARRKRRPQPALADVGAASARYGAEPDARYGAVGWEDGFPSEPDDPYETEPDDPYETELGDRHGSESGDRYGAGPGDRYESEPGLGHGTGASAQAGAGSRATQGFAPRRAYGSAPAGGPPHADPVTASGPDAAPAAARRGRGGQHAARHGKPSSRRWRGGAADKAQAEPPPGPVPDRPGPAGQDTDRPTRAFNLEALDFLTRDDDDASAPAWPEPSASDPRAPWERGDV